VRTKASPVPGKTLRPGFIIIMGEKDEKSENDDGQLIDERRP